MMEQGINFRHKVQSPRCLHGIPLVLLFSAVPLVAQRPVINPQGVVNAASQAPDPDLGMVVAHGEIATILGQNLAPSEASATETPLPTSLAGTSVTVGGILAPLFYVSPGRIEFQVPWKFGLVST